MNAIDLTNENAGVVLASASIVLIDFWAPWCAPCRAFAPIYEQAALEHADIVFARVNADQEAELKTAFGIQSLPTLLAVREHVLVAEQPGAISEAVLRNIIEQVKALDMDEVHDALALEGTQP